MTKFEINQLISNIVWFIILLIIIKGCANLDVINVISNLLK